MTAEVLSLYASLSKADKAAVNEKIIDLLHKGKSPADATDTDEGRREKTWKAK